MPISEEVQTKAAACMTNDELADFIDMGCWRPNVQNPDSSAYREAAQRLRSKIK